MNYRDVEQSDLMILKGNPVLSFNLIHLNKPSKASHGARIVLGAAENKGEGGEPDKYTENKNAK